MLVYDVRYNVIAAEYKHYQRAPINSIASLAPSKHVQLTANRSDAGCPLALIGTGTAGYELSLVNLATSDVEVLMTVDDRKNKDSSLLA